MNQSNIDSIKKGLEKDLAIAVLEAVAAGSITLSEVRPISREILEDLDKLTTQHEVQPFLQKVSQKWVFLQKVYDKYKVYTPQHKEEEVINKLSQYINQLK